MCPCVCVPIAYGHCFCQARTAHARLRACAAAEALSAQSKRPQHGTAEMRAALGTAKAAKVAARHLSEGGQKPKEAARAALTSVGAPKRQKQKASSRKRAAGGDDGGGEPAAKVAKGGTRVYAGGGKSGALKPVRSGLSSVQKARAARGGRGRSQFKSKAKHKRK
jgi:hypothetical protein